MWLLFMPLLTPLLTLLSIVSNVRLAILAQRGRASTRPLFR